MKHMMLSFKIEGDVISDHFLMLWFQKDSLDTVNFRTFRTFREGGPGVLNRIVYFFLGGGGLLVYKIFLNFTNFF